MIDSAVGARRFSEMGTEKKGTTQRVLVLIVVGYISERQEQAYEEVFNKGIEGSIEGGCLQDS